MRELLRGVMRDVVRNTSRVMSRIMSRIILQMARLALRLFDALGACTTWWTYLARNVAHNLSDGVSVETRE